jgi:carbohydrate kinase (thermoresistant glucokinase family)
VIVVVMGVTGCGKSTVGAALGERLGWPFLDADDFHPPANVEKMRAGAPLVDDDRWPWLDRLARELASIERAGGHAVLACSALKAAYRERLAVAGDVRFVHLRGSEDLIGERLAKRSHRYMPASLLASQFATLEAPPDAIVVDIDAPVETLVERIGSALEVAALRTSKA